MTKELTFEYSGYNIPVRLTELTGGGPDTFAMISQGHMAQLAQFTPISPHHNVLEIGCGIGRDAIPLANILTSGSYVGVDIIADSIAWCSNNITPRHPNFQFFHFDVKDHLHNASGEIRTRDIVLPIPNESIDRIIAQSVFTHMAEADIVHFLREFRRVMRPGAMGLLTCFVVYKGVFEAAQRNIDRTPFLLSFKHQFDDGCYINDPAAPMGAVAYTPEALTRMVVAGGFLDLRLVFGNWSGALPSSACGQDLLIVTTP